MDGREAHSDAVIGRIGRYTILAELARGGMSQVMIAQRDGSPDICVLKQLLGELQSHQIAEKRFFREAQLAAYLDHPRIARVIDAGFEDGTFCIAMEHIAGCNVEELVRASAGHGRMLPYELSLAVVLGALEGLEYAHDAVDPSGRPLELIHRDLSPRNLMLSFDGQVKIIDFGVARGRVDDFRTEPGMIVGTLRYVSPEQAVAEPLDRRSDLYSLSVVLYELLTGRALIPDGNPIEVLSDVLHRPVRPLSALNPNLPAELDDVLARALAKDPVERYPDARTLRQAIEAAAGDLGRTPRAAIGEFVASEFPEACEADRALKQRARRRYATRSGDFGSGSSRHTLTPPAPGSAPSPLELRVPAARELRGPDESQTTLTPPRAATPRPDLAGSDPTERATRTPARRPPSDPELGDFGGSPTSFTGHVAHPGAGDFDSTKLADFGLTPTDDHMPTAVDRRTVSRRESESLPLISPHDTLPIPHVDDTLVGPLGRAPSVQGALATRVIPPPAGLDARAQAITEVAPPRSRSSASNPSSRTSSRPKAARHLSRSALIMLAISGAVVGLTWATLSWVQRGGHEEVVMVGDPLPVVRATPAPPRPAAIAREDTVTGRADAPVAMPGALPLEGGLLAPVLRVDDEPPKMEPRRTGDARRGASRARPRPARADRRRAEAERGAVGGAPAEPVPLEDEPAEGEVAVEPAESSAEPLPQAGSPSRAAEASRARLEALIDRASKLRKARPESAAALEKMIADASAWLTASDAARLGAAADQLESRLGAVSRE